MPYRPPILITGAARSRTSLVAGIVNICGAFGGKMSGSDRYNKKGFFENIKIREQIIKPFLISIGVDPFGQNPLPNISELGNYSADEWYNRVMEIMIGDGLKEDESWFIKDAKISLIWPVWKDAFPEAKWIIVRCRTDGIINSCIRTAFMKAYNDQNGWRRWLEYHKEGFWKLKDSGVDCRPIWTDDIISGSLSSIKVIINWLGLIWNEVGVKDFIEPLITES